MIIFFEVMNHTFYFCIFLLGAEHRIYDNKQAADNTLGSEHALLSLIFATAILQTNDIT